MIRLAVRCPAESAEAVLAELLELAPGGVEEVDHGDVVEYAVYGPPGELPALRGRRHGDLRVVVNVVIPRRLSQEQKELLERLAGTLTEDNLRSEQGVFSKLKRAFGG